MVRVRLSVVHDSRSGLDRRTAVLVIAVSSLALVALTAWLVPWDWVPGGDLTPMRPEQLFTPAEIARGETFAEQRRLLAWSSYAVSLLVAAGLGLTPLGSALLRRVFGRFHWVAGVVGGVGAVLLTGRIVTLPFALLTREQNLAYGLTTQGLFGWARDQAVSFLVGWVTTALLVLALVACARRWTRRWYVAAGAVAALLTVLGSYLYPVVVEPLFNDFTSMPEGDFRSSVLRLAEKEGVDVTDVLVADASRRTTTLNAYVSGFGETRRVVVYDTLLESLPADEALVVVAHELAHAKHNDVLLGTGLGVLGGIGGVALLALVLDTTWARRRSGTRGAADPAAVALLMALAAVGSFVASPLVNTVSRSVEARADRDSLAATDPDAAFVAVQRQLALRAVHDPTPPAWSQWWLGSHPTALQRAGLPASLRGAGE